MQTETDQQHFSLTFNGEHLFLFTILINYAVNIN